MIINYSKEIGLIKRNTKIIPIKTYQYPSLVKRPSYSVLNCDLTKNLLSYEGKHWKVCLREILKDMKVNGNNSYPFKSNLQI